MFSVVDLTQTGVISIVAVGLIKIRGKEGDKVSPEEEQEDKVRKILNIFSLFYNLYARVVATVINV